MINNIEHIFLCTSKSIPLNIRHTYALHPQVKARNPRDRRNQTVPGTREDLNPPDTRRELDTTLAASLGNNIINK